MRHCAFSLTTLGLLLAAAGPIAAAMPPCAYPEKDQPCIAFWEVDAVFVGRATAVEKRTGEYSLATRFEVVEALSGVSEPAIEIRSGSAEEDFGYVFEIGESYLVYAYHLGDGSLATSPCWGTRPLSRAEGHLAYARQAVRGEERTGLYGRVAHETRRELQHATAIEPLSGIQVTVQGAGGQRFSAVTNERGEFTVAGHLKGRYTVRAETRPGLPPAIPETVEVPAGRCEGVEIAVTTLGGVRGRVAGSGKRPSVGRFVSLLPWAALESRPLPKPNESVETDIEGRFVLERIPAGEYLLVVTRDDPAQAGPLLSPVFFPGTQDRASAVRVRVLASQISDLPDLYLP